MNVIEANGYSPSFAEQVKLSSAPRASHVRSPMRQGNTPVMHPPLPRTSGWLTAAVRPGSYYFVRSGVRNARCAPSSFSSRPDDLSSFELF